MKRAMKAIYKITNIVTGMFYIGSSKDVEQRIKQHEFLLRTNIHPNKKLQHSYNKYGREAFDFEIVEELTEESTQEQIYAVEQVYLDAITDRRAVFNLCFTADGGGADAKAMPVYLLNLDGTIREKFNSLQDCRRYFGNISQIPTRGINKNSRFMVNYRIVTPEFYHNNLRTILEWEDKTPMDRYRESVQKRAENRKIIVTVGGKQKEFPNMGTAAEFLGISPERVRQILRDNDKPRKNRITKKYDIRYKHEVDLILLPDFYTQEYGTITRIRPELLGKPPLFSPQS